MERILYGDNQFFAVNHISDAKSMAQSIKFKSDEAIIRTLDYAIEAGINTFMCTTHDRIARICDVIRANPNKYKNFKIYPCMPYAHKYANAVTELGIQGTIKQYVPGNLFGTMFKGGMAVVSKDFLKIMELLIDAEMKMFKGINTPVIFLQNVITDLLLGLGMVEVLKGFHDYIIKKYDAEPGFITMNMPKLLDTLEGAGINNPIICFSMNKVNFRMSGGKDLYEKTLKTRKLRAIAMQVLGGGAIPPKEALEYVSKLPNVESILFGASSKANIENTVYNIRSFDKEKIT
ncbi:aldo-keto reductase family protein [Salegentibacter mishustinae]|jgi:hypothetical protein|uniref:Uncharacterized protein n=1 Tax=Salegentibacter mishustinae TaxID=270918 RepID=A0A0Q9Z5T5_9FLAO|nr:hypothetical protein [Salegentibacter mishustinae]KRG28301.1 hypothetical protein APR42_05805 [Salegentibacter mishustinae]PNW22236.1 hypothetical protein APB85_13570 [Salegentibacter mishustinae]PZX67457.1 hypothetical protein LY54_00187 [Salegentibacter mishustinae]GGW79613.1 hypothetical protein GCM10008086_04200 [Salegentibacter mishustinae]